MTEHIFEQPWWIDAATDGAFHHVSFSEGESVHAEIIVVSRRHRLMNHLSMPHLARVWTPKISFGTVQPKNPLSTQIRALNGLIERLPAHDYLSYTLPPESDLVLAHDLSGFQAAPAYTFRAPLDRDIMAAMDQKIRYNVRSGAKKMRVIRHGDVGKYIDLSKKFIQSRAFNDNFDYDAVARIYEASAARDQALIISAVDGQNEDVASAVLLWDEATLYYWLNCRNLSLNDYTANSVLIWQAIQIAREKGLQFDIDGYGTPNAGVFLSRFGLLPVPRFCIRRQSTRYTVQEAAYRCVTTMVGSDVRGKLLAARNRLTRLATPFQVRWHTRERPALPERREPVSSGDGRRPLRQIC